ncbi:MAG: hypothetical protein HGA19_07525 [Oscillochloris sp.]|nr:hypothetical protein [Oscillochloris sp.]
MSRRWGLQAPATGRPETLRHTRRTAPLGGAATHGSADGGIDRSPSPPLRVTERKGIPQGDAKDAVVNACTVRT